MWRRVGRIGPETRDPVDAELIYFQTPGRAKMTSVPRPPVVSEDGIINRKGAVDQHVLKEFIMESEQDLDVGLEAEMADDNDDADADDDQDARAPLPTLLADRAEPARSPALARARARAGT